MNTQKVLFLAYYFPPSGEAGIYRILYFNKYLPDFGWHSHVLAPSNAKYAIFDPRLLSLISKNTTVHRCFTNELFNRGLDKNHDEFYSQHYLPKQFQRLYYGLNIFFSIPDTKKGWSRYAARAAKKIILREKVSAVFVSGPPFSSFLVAPYLKKHLPEVKIIIDYRDPWTSNLEVVPFTKIHERLQIRKERKVLRCVDGIICNTPTNREFLCEQIPKFPKDNIIVITNGYDEEDFRNKDDLLKYNEFVITHAGTFYRHVYDISAPKDSFSLVPCLARYRKRREHINELMKSYSPVNFLRGVREFLDENEEAKEHLRIIFTGEPGKGYEKLVAELNLTEWVDFTGFLPYAENIVNIIRSHALLFTLSSGEESRGWIPSKLYQYIGSGNPVLSLIPRGDAYDIAEKSGLSVFADQEDIHSIKSKILYMYDKYRQKEEYRIPQWDYIRQYNRKHLANRLADFMNHLISKQSFRNQAQGEHT